ncbi:hypothetical protein OG824_25310 [Streptomyces prunicolor]|jgi:hypothetical protein|uniref:hypothetical protein n=1 Tax=Streptomyces prunicolor TaxID=67348 RepID=UPI00225055D8|nr:hypothetical protein [Streptomyces prunicolor]MCX5238520.1 hypothetical protein [Streptomyces prunicolor]
MNSHFSNDALRPGTSEAVCLGPYGDPSDGMDCSSTARFQVLRHRQPVLLVCPVHLGPSLLMADGVLWPPQLSLIR